MTFKALIVAAGVTVFCNGPVWAQNYPNRAIRFIVQYPPGGGGDTFSRIIGTRLAENLGQPVVIDNRGGAGGRVGMTLALKSAPDGYTIIYGAPGMTTVAASLYRSLPYDPLRDFAPVSLVAISPTLLVVHPSLPVESVRELITHARAQPGKLNFGSSGNGGSGHLGGAMFNVLAAVNMVHVPYGGTGPATLAMIRNEAQVCFCSISAVLPHVRSGRLRGIAVSSGKRSIAVPDVPTVAEAGLAGFHSEVWQSILVPAKTPAVIVARLNAELVQIAKDADMRQKLLSIGVEPVGSTPGELAAYMKADFERWRKVIRAADIRAD